VTAVSSSGSSVSDPAAHFTYFTPGAPRTIDQVLPDSGPGARGTTVTIIGTGLASAIGVTFGSHAGTNLQTMNATRLTVETPPGKGAVGVTAVTTAGDSAPSPAAQFTYTTPGAPSVTGLAPTSGPPAGGTVVMITGKGLSHATAVKFGHSDGTMLTRLGDTQLQVSAPPGSGTVPVIVSTPAGSSPASPSASLTYVPAAAPTITGLSPTGGPAAGGTAVTITGTGLANATAVTFGSADGTDVTPISDTELQVQSPPGLDTVPVSVSSSAGTSPASSVAEFTYAAEQSTLAPSMTAPSCHPAQVDTGQSTTCTVTVAPGDSSSLSAPTGTVTLTSDSQGSFNPSTGCALQAGPAGAASCQFAYSPSTVGTATLTARYPGDSNYGASDTTSEITAVSAPPPLRPTSTSLLCSSKPIIANPPWTCTVTVTDVGSGNQTSPTGTVSFTTNGGLPSTTSCMTSPASNNSASCTINARGQLVPSTGSAETVDLFPITADYDGDSTHSASQTQYSPP
jgi:Bacterial Ig-like domain (group 3)/IPT/TIG domain